MTPPAAWPPPRPREIAGLAALCAGVAIGSLVAYPGWIFGKYPALAAALARGELTAAQVADASPGYLLLALLLPPTVLRLLQSVAGAATVAVVFLVAHRARGRAAAWTAAIVLALAAPWLLYASVLEPDILVGAANASAVLALVAGRTRGRLSGAAVAGALLGLSIALRPTGALLALAALAWILLDGRRALPARARLGRAAALAALAAAVGGGAVLALRARAGHEVGATMSAGQVLHQGHRPEGSGLGANYPTLLALVALQEMARPGHAPDPHHALYRRLASVAEGRTLDAGEAERYWAGKVAAFAAREPGAFLRQLGRKLLFVVTAPAGDADIPGVQEALQRPWRPGIPARWIALVGLGGLLLSLGAGGAAGLVQLWIGAYALAFVVFYFQGRYGLALLPAWSVMCGLAAAEVAAAIREPGRRIRVGVALAAPFLLLLPRVVRDEDRLLERTALVPVRSEAVALRSEGRWREALERHADEQAALPDHVWPWSPHGFALDVDSPDQARAAADRARRRFGDASPVDAYLLAVLESAAGRCAEALPLAARASRAGFHGAIADTALDPDLLSAGCHLAQGDREAAYRSVRASLARWPGTLDGLALAVALGEAQAGPTGPEVLAWEAELRALHDPASTRYALARARRRTGAPLRALEDARWLSANLREADALAAFEEALALVDLGRDEDALRAYARALAAPFAMHEAGRLDGPVRSAYLRSPDDAGVARLALAHWSARGDLGEIRAVLRRHPELATPSGGR